ncbi:MAG: hypothetical protein KKE05_05670, partial [Nanoarchaeota archaeon]|nr:hypothetical protein [Nanoarchaeota archaeon]
ELWKLNKDYYNNLSKEKLAEELFKSGIEHAFLTAEKLHEDLKKQRKIYSLYAMDYNQLNFEDGNSSPCFKAEVSLP